jgi:hypothetical protein
MKKNKTKNIAGVTLMEMLIGVAITSLMMGAMFTTYSVVKNSYNQVTDRAKISRSGRDIVGMMIKDIRLAGFKYYYGDNDEGIPAQDDLTHISGLEDGRDIIDSHDPIIVMKSMLGYDSVDEASPTTVNAHSANDLCCDRIHIVYGDFNKEDPDQKYKRYKITYYAKPMESNENDKFYGVYKTKESWVENITATKGDWVSNCSECYKGELVRSHLVDMEFLLFDAQGRHLNYPRPDENSENLYLIKQVDMRLTFRSNKDFYRSGRKTEDVEDASGATEKKIIKPRLVKGLSEDRTRAYKDKYLRESTVVSIYTRNIGGY